MAEQSGALRSIEEQDAIGLAARLGAVLFVSVKPLGLQTLADAVGAKVEDVSETLDILSQRFDADSHGFVLCEVAGGWQFRTHPGAAQFIKRLIPSRAKRISRAAAETLAVIAYKQPVQRAEIEAIRGVDALPTLKTLLDANLVRVVGREDSAGQPALYGTTTRFLERFGLSDLSELPSVRELSELDSEPGETSVEEEEA